MKKRCKLRNRNFFLKVLNIAEHAGKAVHFFSKIYDQLKENLNLKRIIVDSFYSINKFIFGYRINKSPSNR